MIVGIPWAMGQQSQNMPCAFGFCSVVSGATELSMSMFEQVHTNVANKLYYI